MEASQVLLLLNGDILVILCPWLIQEKTGQMRISPEDRWLIPSHGRPQGGRRGTEDQRHPPPLLTVQGSSS